MHRLTLLLAGLLVWVIGIQLPTATAQDAPAAADRLMALMEDARIPGLSITVISEGAVAETYSLGVRSTATSPPVTDESVFEAASLSKPVVAYLVHRLADAGRFDLDRPLAEYLAYDRAAADPRLFDVTGRVVLMHASGFPNWRPAGGDLVIQFDPGSMFSYSGEGFVMLQQALERALFTSLEDLAQEWVFQPLGMTHSSFVWQETFGASIAVGHDLDGLALDKFTPQQANAAFSLHTTTTDYARFMIAVVTGEGLDDASRMGMTTPQISAQDGIYWGEGIGLEPTPAGQALWHWGDQAGYRAFAYVSPEASSGFVYVANSDNGMLVLDAVYDLIITGPGTAVSWLNYESVDDPGFLLGRELMDVLRDQSLDAALARYESAKGDMTAEAFVEESLNTLAYKLMRSGKVDEAVAFFALNAEEYPDSYNVYDSLGEAYFIQGNFDEALSQYRKSLLINPANENGKLMIATIRDRLGRN